MPKAAYPPVVVVARDDVEREARPLQAARGEYVLERVLEPGVVDIGGDPRLVEVVPHRQG